MSLFILFRYLLEGASMQAKWKHFLLSLIPIIAIAVPVAVTYSESTQRFHTADQWFYLIDTVNDVSFGQTVADTFSWNRTRQVAPGDRGVFRPLFFVFLALEKSLFEYRAELWQMMGIVLHIAIACLLYLFGVKIILPQLLHDPPGSAKTDRKDRHPSGRKKDEKQSAAPKSGRAWSSRLPIEGAALAVALFFALNQVLTQQVTWNHINGYQITLILVVLVAFLMPKSSVVQSSPWSRYCAMGGMWMLLALAAFNSELGMIAAIAAAITVFLCTDSPTLLGRFRYAIAFLLIPLLYMAANQLDLRFHPFPASEDAFDPETVLRAERAFSLMTLQNIWDLFDKSVFSSFFPFDNVIGWLALAAYFVLTALGVFKQHRAGWKRREGCVSLYLVLLCIGYVVATAYARLNPRPGSYRGYYAHPILALFLLATCPFFLRGVAALANWVRWGRKTLAAAVCVYLAILLILNASATSQIVVKRLDICGMPSFSTSDNPEAIKPFCAQVRAFIDKHAAEPDFSMAMDPADSPMVMNAPVFSVLFRNFENVYKPKYLLRWNGTQLSPFNREEYLKLNPNQEQQVPHFLKCFSPIFYIWRFQDKYWASAVWDNNVPSAKEPAQKTAVGDSVDAVIKHLPSNEQVVIDALLRGMPSQIDIARPNVRGYQILCVIFYGERIYIIIPNNMSIGEGLNLSLRAGGLITAVSLRQCDRIISTFAQDDFAKFIAAYMQSRKAGVH
jgi:hypothetical protein